MGVLNLRTILTYTNSTGESITLGSGAFLFNKLEGLGDVDADIQQQSAPYQDGTTYIDSILAPRFISFEVLIVGKGNTITSLRSQLSSVFNPKLGIGQLKVKIGDSVRIINAVPDHVPSFPSGIENRGNNHQVGIVDLICPNPYWQSPSITEEPAFEPLFEFPFEGEFEMGMQRDQRIIVNDSDAPAPLQVEFFGPALNPKIINNTTGEYIKVNKQLEEDERMMIDTSDSNKSVYFVDSNGNERNVFNWIDLDSTFFKLIVGENDIEYTADSDIQGAIVNISYSKLYTAV